MRLFQANQNYAMKAKFHSTCHCSPATYLLMGRWRHGRMVATGVTMTVRARMSIKHMTFPTSSTQSSQLASTDRQHHGQAHPLLLGKNISREPLKGATFSPHIQLNLGRAF